jgi:hypothetical protein
MERIKETGMPTGIYERKTLKERFDEKWILDIETGCWLWIASKNSGGYGQIRNNGSKGTMLYAHRVAYELYREPIPEELEIDHLCRVHNCINPWHLEAVTHSVNVLRGLTPILTSQRSAKIKSCPRGHEYTEENTYIYSQKSSSGRIVHNRRCRACGRSRQRGIYLKPDYPCKACGKKTKNFKYCSLLCNSFSQRKVDRPNKDQLLLYLSTMSYCAVGRKYGVSDNAIRKWVRKYENII